MQQRTRILIVEDEALIALELAWRLSDMGHEVVGTAASGAQAFALATTKHPDLILMDINIKGPDDGIVTAARIRAVCDVPVVFLSAFSDPATIERAGRVAQYGFLQKPYEADRLCAVIEQALATHRAERLSRADAPPDPASRENSPPGDPPPLDQ